MIIGQIFVLGVNRKVCIPNTFMQLDFTSDWHSLQGQLVYKSMSHRCYHSLCVSGSNKSSKRGNPQDAKHEPNTAAGSNCILLHLKELAAELAPVITCIHVLVHTQLWHHPCTVKNSKHVACPYKGQALNCCQLLNYQPHIGVLQAQWVL